MRFLFLLLVVVNSFFTIPVQIENERLKLGLVIPTSPTTTVANDAIEMLPFATNKTIYDLSK